MRAKQCLRFLGLQNRNPNLMKTKLLNEPFCRTLMVLACSALTVSFAMAQVVSIPDHGLEQAIRQTLGQPTGPIAASDLASLKQLDAHGMSITSLAGLEAAVNLQVLDLRYNSLTSLTLPSSLTQLQELDLDDNRLQDFSFLAGRSSLRILRLYGNGLTGLALPAGLDGLTQLNIGGNSITDFSFLSGLPHLSTLSLYDGGLSQLTLPPGLDNLSELDLGFNRLTDFSFLDALPSLTSLDLSDNQLSSLVLPPGLVNLRTLNLEANQLTDTSFLAGLSLTSLNLRDNRLKQINLPPGMSGLSTLELGNNTLTDFSFLAALPNLAILDLSGNQIQSLTLPATFSNLSTLEVSFNQLASLTLPYLPNLSNLSLTGNPIKRLTVPGPNSTLVSQLTPLESGGLQVTFLPVLTVNSSNPGTGVVADVTPADQNGAGNGVTDLNRVYSDGAVVNVSVPATADGNSFQKWQIDGTDYSTSPSTSVIMDGNHSLTAVYGSGPLAPQNVAESANYSLVYSLSIPNEANYNAGGVPYDIDNHANVGPFKRIGYYLEMQPVNGAPQFLWVSMDAFTTDAGKIGVPAIQTGAFFQQKVANMNVRSSVPGVATGDALPGGNIEFWWCNYGKSNQAGIPGASDSTYDFGDHASPNWPAGYGSMQVHNWAAAQTLFAFNGWGEAPDPIDIGIGPNPGGYPDWTMAQNAADYSSKVLQVYVLPEGPGSSQPLAPANVAEAGKYSLVYSLEIPDIANLNADGVNYAVDNHAALGAFSRVAYYLELQPNSGPVQFVWVSMEAFSADAGKLGVPTIQTGAFFQQPLANMNVSSSVPGVVTGNGLTGNIEFWPCDYGKSNGAGVLGASNSLYDFGDTASATWPAGYGSMQIHNPAAGQTLFALNGWGEDSEVLDLGIGNCPGTYPDWTFAQNANQYSSKVLQVYVLPMISIH
jgi:Leucine-rich repeat (LRR) protein